MEQRATSLQERLAARRDMYAYNKDSTAGASAANGGYGKTGRTLKLFTLNDVETD